MTYYERFYKKITTLLICLITIRLLLLGNEENINIAGLLFEITKDKKINSNYI